MVGTNHLAIRSATYWIGACLLCVVSTNLINWLITAFSANFVTLTTRVPLHSKVPPNTF